MIAAAASCSAVTAPVIAAHRGGLDSGFPENTLPAFQHAQRQGARFIELDLRTTADGEIVVLHDRSVRRTTNGSGLIDEMSLEDARRLNAGDNQRIPLLSEVLAWAEPSSLELLLDVKQARALPHAGIVDAVVSAGLRKRVLFGVRSLDDLQSFADHDNELRFLGLVPSRASIDEFVSAGVEAIRLWPGWLDAGSELVMSLRNAGVAVWVTAGDPPIDRLRAFAALGVQGLIVDRPALALSAFGCAAPVTAPDQTPRDAG